jgi:HD-GYP domain-containing protein (c-di-GMP phosphodiesterase class II)
MSFQPLNHDDLTLGLFIKIDGSWFSHPFPTNTFKITTQKELVTLRGLRKVQLFFDPERSEGELLEMESPATLEKSPIRKIEKPWPIEMPPPVSPSPPLEVNRESRPMKLHPIVAFEHHCEGLKNADSMYQDAFQKSKEIIHSLSKGDFSGIEMAEDLIASLEAMVESSDATTGLMNVMSVNTMGEGMFMHALNVCLLSLLVGREFGFSEEELQLLAIGALFHDIGELDVPGKILLNRRNLTTTERDVYRQHPLSGRDMLKKFSAIPPRSLEAIYQHHERLDGSGYPMGLKGEEAISVFAKIIMVVDWYEDQCHDADVERCLTPSEALSQLFVKQKSVFSGDVVVALIRILGVYPPGSLVKLNDGSTVMVVSINERARMRPLVIKYVEGSDWSTKNVMDLEEHEDLSITQNLRPREVPQRVREILNPRRMLEYVTGRQNQESFLSVGPAGK